MSGISTIPNPWLEELAVAKTAAILAGEYLAGLSSKDKTVLSSIGRDIKLQADQDAERIILNHLNEHSRYPVLAEESGETGAPGKPGHECFWAVDPLDGTLNFKRNIPVCAVSLALVQEKTPVLGVINDFNRKKIYYGSLDHGAFCNDEPIHVNPPGEIGQAVIATGFPVRLQMDDAAGLKFLKTIRQFKKQRMIGSAALSLAWVAAGHVDCYMENNIMLWDVAAGIAIVLAAGGVLRMQPMDDPKWSNHICCAAHQGLLAQIP